MKAWKKSYVSILALLSLVLAPVAPADDSHSAASPPKCGEYSYLALNNDGIWRRTPQRGIPILVRGGDEASFHVKPEAAELNEIPVYDTIIVGGGLSGLTAGVYLTDGHKKVLMLEKENQLGGLAAGGERWGIRYARGAAYFSAPDGNQVSIFDHVGLGNYAEKYAIPEPIDSYLWNGKLYKDVWEHEALAELPKNFSLFKHALEAVAEKIPTQPIEDSHLLQWDKMTAAEWIRKMPKSMAARRDPESKQAYAEFKADKRINKEDPMKEVIEFVDLFSRSALGRESHEISATAFANFYISEIAPRYTGPMGSGDIANRLSEILASRAKEFKAKTGSTVTRIKQLPEGGLEITYVRNGDVHSVHARKVIFAGPIGMAPELIEGFAEKAPQHAKVISGLEYAHYSVHNVFVEGHPFRESYDLWIRDQKYSQKDPTDVILGRWQDPKIKGYLGTRDFKTEPGDETGILTIYHPLPENAVGKGYSNQAAIQAAESALIRTEEMLGPLIKAQSGKEIKVRAIETNRWPYSIHIVKPGWLSDAKILNEPVGDIHFANNNMGLPSVEEAMYRGQTAAQRILRELETAPEAGALLRVGGATK
jgi:hypothetical protein